MHSARLRTHSAPIGIGLQVDWQRVGRIARFDRRPREHQHRFSTWQQLRLARDVTAIHF